MPIAESPQGYSPKFPTWLTLTYYGWLLAVTDRVGVSRRLFDARRGGRDEPGDERDWLAAVRAGGVRREAVPGDCGRRGGRTRDVGRRGPAGAPPVAGVAVGLGPAVLAPGAAVLLPRGGRGPGERVAAGGAVPLLGAHRAVPAAVTALRITSARCWWGRIR